MRFPVYIWREPYKDRWDAIFLRFLVKHKARFGRWFRHTFQICQIVINHDTGDCYCNTHATMDPWTVCGEAVVAHAWDRHEKWRNDLHRANMKAVSKFNAKKLTHDNHNLA